VELLNQINVVFVMVAVFQMEIVIVLEEYSIA